MEKKLKILLVDDDELIRTLYADVFKMENFDVVEAVNGMEGFDKALAEKPDMIMTGIIMPKMDGFALVDALKSNVATTNIPVMMSSHMGREDDRKRALEMGVKEFFVVGMITPKKVVEEIRAMFESKNYRLAFNAEALDGPKLSADFHFENGFNCAKCNKQKVLSLKIGDVAKKEFRAVFICPDCE